MPHRTDLPSNSDRHLAPQLMRPDTDNRQFSPHLPSPLLQARMKGMRSGPANRCGSRELAVHYQPAASAIGQWSTNSNALGLRPLACRNFAYLTANDEHRNSDGITEKRIIRSSSLRPGSKKNRPPGNFQPACGWSRRESNPLPPHCERGALPNELRPQHLRTTTHVFLTRNNRSQTTGTLNRKLNSMASFSAGTMLRNKTALLNSTAPQNNKVSQNNDGPGTHRRLRIHTSNSDRLVQVLVHQWSRYSSTRSTHCP